MSEIDGYRHRCIGIIRCPSHYPIVAGNDSHRNVPLYWLEEDAWTATSWQAKCGDLLLGGGSGESAALRIAMPEAIDFYTSPDGPAIPSLGEIQCAYWTPTQAFVFGEGYVKMGWAPLGEALETWLVQHILAFVRREYPALWGVEWGPGGLSADRSICRLPTPAEVAGW